MFRPVSANSVKRKKKNKAKTKQNNNANKHKKKKFLSGESKLITKLIADRKKNKGHTDRSNFIHTEHTFIKFQM